MGKLTSSEDLFEALALYEQLGSYKLVAAELNISLDKVDHRVRDARKLRALEVNDQIAKVINEFVDKDLLLVAEPGKPARYIVGCVQIGAALDQATWKNVRVIQDHYKARLLIASFTYNKDARGQRRNSPKDDRINEVIDDIPPEVEEFLYDKRFAFTDNLHFCGESNFSPTAANPLAGMSSYAPRISTIFPHPRLEVVSVAAARGKGVKMMYTTGCLTRPNYVDTRKAAAKAKNFHALGVCIIEVDEDGCWWVRHMLQGDDGTMYEVADNRDGVGFIYAKDGVVHPGDRVADITFGDIHSDKVDRSVADISWGSRPDSMMSVLCPWTSHVHDILDWSGRSHHTLRNLWEVQKSKIDGRWNADQELVFAANLLWRDIARENMTTVIVNSNHDRHLDQWVDNEYKNIIHDSPENAYLIYELMQYRIDEYKRQKAAGIEMPYVNLAEYALRKYLPEGCETKTVIFLPEDETSKICENVVEGGIECGLHGDRGPNGTRGTPTAFANMDTRINFADKHTAIIKGWAYGAGTSSKLNMGYNKGPSSWTHAHILTYPNGMRTIISIYKGKWRA